MSTKLIMSTLLLVASTVACYGWRTEPLLPEDTTLAARTARITLFDGRSFEVAGPRIARDTLSARRLPDWSSASQPVVVPVSQILRIESRHLDPGNTAALTVGLISIAAVVAAVITLNTMSFDLGCFAMCHP